MAAAVAASLLLGLASLPTSASALPLVDVFRSYQPGQSECYRQPLLVAAGSSLVALVEGRNNISYCSGTDYPDSPLFPIVARVSSDAGATWGPLQVVLPAANLDFLVSVYDPLTATIHLMVQLGDDGVVYTTSPNGGVSWTPAANLSIPSSFASVIPGVGHGLSISGGHCLEPTCDGAAGKLVLPFVCTESGPVSNDTYCVYCRACLLVSDDHGANWAIGAVSSQVGAREAAVAQLDSKDFNTLGAVLAINARNLGPVPGHRMEAVSLDGGVSFDGSLYRNNSVLPDVVTANWTGVVSGFTRIDTSRSPSAGKDILLFTAPNGSGSRANLTAYVSSGIGPNPAWSALPSAVVNPLWSGDAAYSDAAQVNATHVGILFEAGMTAAPSGDFAARVCYVAIPIAAL